MVVKKMHYENVIFFKNDNFKAPCELEFENPFFPSYQNTMFHIKPDTDGIKP